MSPNLKRTTEELWNTLTHGVGAVASVAAGAVLIVFASLYGNATQIVGASVFVAALVLLYTASAVYHGVLHPLWKRRLEILDHSAIYVLIAGTYTPFLLVTLNGPWGWSLFGVVWGLAVVGIGFKLFFTGRFELVSTLIYVLMGWLIVVAIQPLMASISAWGMAWLVAGGLAYTAGTFFYLNKKMRFAHPVWHLFVLAGSVCHFVSVWSQVVPG
ncbi:MAG: hemolysin III family protein [Meiothermus sp.]|nr:hemolysin III family protein [Meiothermus sp.]